MKISYSTFRTSVDKAKKPVDRVEVLNFLQNLAYISGTYGG